MTYSDAGEAALAELMRIDTTIWEVGEDLGSGGVFGQYVGLENEFGPERIVSTPISEAAIMDAAVGGAPRIPILYFPSLEDTVRITAEDLIRAVMRLD